MPKKLYTVFLSSTHRDLATHREAAAKAILQLGAVPFALESFAASGEPVAEVMKSQLTESDVAVFIVGQRYGAVIPDTGSSWVEAEYDAAS
jgi:ribonucleotide monophosphatase NagD (HAD superfamily)